MIKMKRRSFLQGLAASAGAVVAPVSLPTIAKPAAVTAKVIPFHYGWACVYAQMNNGVSAADIARVFKISNADASELMERMMTRGVIQPPGLDGRSHPTRVWEPWDKKSAPPQAPKNTAEPDAHVQTGGRARARFQRFILNLKSEPQFEPAH